MSPLFRAEEVGPLEVRPAPIQNGYRRAEVLVRLRGLSTIDADGKDRPAEAPLDRAELEQLQAVIAEALA